MEDETGTVFRHRDVDTHVRPIIAYSPFPDAPKQREGIGGLRPEYQSHLLFPRLHDSFSIKTFHVAGSHKFHITNPRRSCHTSN